MSATTENTNVAGGPANSARHALRARLISMLGSELRVVPVLLVLVVLGLIFSLLSPFFLAPRNITFLVLQTVPTALMSLSLIFVLFVAEIDLSMASLSAVASAITAVLLVVFGVDVFPAMAAGIVAGCGVGILQAVIVLVFGAPSFLVTLGMSFILSGVLVLILPEKAAQISIVGTPLATMQDAYIPAAISWGALVAGVALDAWLRFLHTRGMKAEGLPTNPVNQILLPSGAIAICFGLAVWYLNLYKGVPVMVGLLIVILVVASYVLNQTAFGRHIFAVGGNREGARRAGVRVNTIVIIAFTLSGGIAALAGLAAAVRQLSVSIASGGGLLMLSAVAGAVIGGASLFGGRGNVWAALLGPLIIATISNGFDLMAAPPYLRIISIGTILVLAVILDTITVRGKVFAQGGR